MKRTFLLSVATALIVALTGCSSASAPGTPQPGGDKADSGAVSLQHPSIEGLKIDFPKRPTKLVMDCYAYSSLHEYGIEPAALFGYECDSPQIMKGIDVSKIEKVGKDGEIDMEKLAALRPDAVVGNGTEKGWSWFKEDVNAQLKRVAPFVPIPSGGTVDQNIANMRTIAGFFGADVTAAKILQADKDFDTAKKAFTQANQGKSLNYLLTSPTKEVLYTGVGFPQADLLAGLGATIIGAPKPATGNPWGKVAWEEAGQYPADIILIESYSPESAFSSELWDALPAIKARQITGWYSKGALTSRNYADWLSDVARKVTESHSVS